jgi:ureidoglycolate lyase
MKTIQAKKLTKEGFAPYGTYENLLDNAANAAKSTLKDEFYPDLLTLNFGTSTSPSVCVCRIPRVERPIVTFIEAHKFTCEGLLPLDADVVIYVGILSNGELDSDYLEAFYVPKGTFVKFEPLIVHGRQFVFETDEAHALCLLPQRTYYNDLIIKQLPVEEQVEVLV